MPPWNLRVGVALQDAHRHIDFRAFVQDQMVPPVFDELSRDSIAIAIAGRHEPFTLRFDRSASLFIQTRPQQRLRHVDGGCEQHEAAYALEMAASLGGKPADQQQRQIAAHARSGDDHWPPGDLLERMLRPRQPVADCSFGEEAFG